MTTTILHTPSPPALSFFFATLSQEQCLFTTGDYVSFPREITSLEKVAELALRFFLQRTFALYSSCTAQLHYALRLCKAFKTVYRFGTSRYCGPHVEARTWQPITTSHLNGAPTIHAHSMQPDLSGAAAPSMQAALTTSSSWFLFVLS